MIVTLEEVNASTKPFFVGADEVGYGALAGPVVIGAVRAPRDWHLDGLNDSKKLSEKRREVLNGKLQELIAVGTIQACLAVRESVEIDQAGVTSALKSAYVECFRNLYSIDSLIIIDGNMNFDGLHVDSYDKVSLIKADQKISTVMAASILAKVWRDNEMKMRHKDYPDYGFDSNVGYGSSKHLKAIATKGPCLIHRFSYAPMKNM